MAKNSKILPGGFKNEIEWNKLEAFVKEHLRYKLGVPTTDKEAEAIAIDLYVWVQERKRKNAPIITENDVWNYACECPEIHESL